MSTENNSKIVVGDIQLDVVRKNIKNLHLAVYPPTGRVRVAAPLRMDNESIRLFVISKIGWIKRHQSTFEFQERQTKREYVTGESHYFFGNRYLLNVIYHDSKPRIEIRNKTYIDLFVRMGSDEAKRESVMTDWYRNELKEQSDLFIDKWKSIVGVDLDDWRIRKMKTRWGSCSFKNKRIWINLELVKKPYHCLEFIIVHELTHLLERRHNDRFRSLMDSFLPQWRVYKQELNQFILNYDG